MAGKYALELDNTHAGWLATPGAGYLDIDPWIRRKQGAFGLHPGSHRGLWEWIEGSPYGERRNGAIVGFDADGREIERLVFTDATVSELEMPALDAAHANAAALSLRLAIGAAAVRAGGEASIEARADAVAIAGCRLQLAGAGPSTHRVDTIEALTITTRLGRRSHAGLQRVVLGFDPGHDAAAMWDEALVGREGALEYLASDATFVLARLEFHVAGVYAEAMKAAAGRAGRTRVELACRGLQFALPAMSPVTRDMSAH